MKSTSLRAYFHRQSVKWSLIGLGLVVIVAIPCLFYAQKAASERELMVLVKSVARAFRPMILEDNIRDAEFQMRRVLDLKDDESIVVRDPDFRVPYPINKTDVIAKCTTPLEPCHIGFKYLSILYPIYFDDERETRLYGYLELTIHPAFDWAAVLLLIPLLAAAFFALALGLSSALNQSANKMVEALSTWAGHLKNEPQSSLRASSVSPYKEFEPMREAIDGLYIEIEKLKTETAKTAKADGQLALLREISHDLRTPHSLLAKFFSLHLDTLQTTGRLKQAEVDNIETTLIRMGDLLRQVRVAPLSSSSQNTDSDGGTVCRLETECRSIANALENLPLILNKKASIRFHSEDVPMAGISKTALFRIMDNLVSNAAEAVNPGEGVIEIEVIKEDGCPILIVRDNGCGIPFAIRDKIFDFDFTTNFARGTGLGLGIVKKICQEFGAEISFESAEDVGTEFKVSFTAALIFDRYLGKETFSGGINVQV